MDEEEWRKLSEHERQQLILKSKLAQRALRREMYGDDWQRQLAALQGDEAALEAYRRNQREMFNKRLAAMVALRRKPEHLDEIGDGSLETITEKEEDALCADWVKAQMDEETWRKMSEKERQAYLAKMKLLQRQLRKDMYGDEWSKQLQQLGNDEAALANLKNSQREEFNRRLAALLAAKRKAEHLSDIGDENVEKVSEKESEKLCADWVKKNMDEEYLRNMSEKERQAYIAKMKLLQKQLRSEMYGDEWQKQLKQLEGDDLATEKLRKAQREAFNKKLAMLLAAKRKATHISDLEDETVDDSEKTEKVEEKLCADWVKAQMSEEAWRNLSVGLLKRSFENIV